MSDVDRGCPALQLGLGLLKLSDGSRLVEVDVDVWFVVLAEPDGAWAEVVPSCKNQVRVDKELGLILLDIVDWRAWGMTDVEFGNPTHTACKGAAICPRRTRAPLAGDGSGIEAGQVLSRPASLGCMNLGWPCSVDGTENPRSPCCTSRCSDSGCWRQCSAVGAGARRSSPRLSVP